MIEERHMNARTVIQTPGLPGFIPAGKISRSFRTLLPMLALCSAVVAWSQAPGNLPGPQFPQNIPPEAMKAPSAPAPTSILNARQRLRRAQASTNDLATATPLEAAQYSFVNFTIPAAVFVQPNAINNAGLVAGFYLDADSNFHGFVWQKGTVTTIDYPGAASTIFGGINNRGVLSGVYQDASYNTYAVTYSLANSAWTVLPAIPGGWQVLSPYNYDNSVGINDDGVAVGCSVKLGDLSWIWHPDSQSYSYFTAPSAAEAATCAQVINNRGNVAGFLSIAYSDSTFAFLREAREQYATIGLPPSLSAGLYPPFGINDSDTTVGSFFPINSANSVSGFIRTRGGLFTIVNQPGYDQTYVTAINDFGVLVGDSYSTATGQSPAFIAFPQE
jgi:hypothetical protein